jgi:hypothetical protein
MKILQDEDTMGSRRQKEDVSLGLYNFNLLSLKKESDGYEIAFVSLSVLYPSLMTFEPVR